MRPFWTASVSAAVTPPHPSTQTTTSGRALSFSVFEASALSNQALQWAGRLPGGEVVVRRSQAEREHMACISLVHDIGRCPSQPEEREKSPDAQIKKDKVEGSSILTILPLPLPSLFLLLYRDTIPTLSSQRRKRATTGRRKSMRSATNTACASRLQASRSRSVSLRPKDVVEGWWWQQRIISTVKVGKKEEIIGENGGYTTGRRTPWCNDREAWGNP